MVPGTGVVSVQAWERELIRHAVEKRFAEEHRDAVLDEFGHMRTAWLASGGTHPPDAAELVRLIVRTQ